MVIERSQVPVHAQLPLEGEALRVVVVVKKEYETLENQLILISTTDPSLIGGVDATHLSDPTADAQALMKMVAQYHEVHEAQVELHPGENVLDFWTVPWSYLLATQPLPFDAPALRLSTERTVRHAIVIIFVTGGPEVFPNQ